MKLQKLVVENFRQFEGVQEIVFSDIRAKNVTLIHAENGFGKTALLNALLWGFYGHDGLTPDVAQKERILHEATAVRAKDKSAVHARVTILFEHEGIAYTLCRSLSLAQQLANSKDTEVTLEFRRDGMTLQDKRPQARIQAIMPDGISHFLFFNGERIDHLAMEENAAEVTEAIKQMLGLTLLQAAIEDIRHPNVIGKLRGDLRNNTTDEKANLIDQQSDIERKIEIFTEKKATAHANIAALDDELEKINAKLEANREARRLQETRKRLESEQSRLRDRQGEVSDRLRKLIAEDGFTLFTSELIDQGKAIMTRLREERVLPAQVMDEFLKELLQKGRCICERELSHGTEAREAVEALLTIAGDQHFNNAVGALDNAIGGISSLQVRTENDLAALNRDRLEIDSELDRIGEELEDIHQKLGGKDDEEVSRLEDSRQKIKLRRDEANRDIGQYDRDLAAKLAEREKLRLQIQKMEDKEGAAQLAQRRLNAAEESAQVLENILKSEIEDLRPILNEEIDTHFQKIIKKNHWARLSEDFVLTVRKEIPVFGSDESVELDVAQSTGERQITSLVFIASLVSLARRRSEIKTIIKGLSGAEYPMVMDSPFGQLGGDFRKGIATWIPDLAPQVVILVSNSQYEGAVEEVLEKSKKVGKRYFLRYHGPSLKKDATPVLTLGGVEYEQYKEADEESTEIVEIGGVS